MRNKCSALDAQDGQTPSLGCSGQKQMRRLGCSGWPNTQPWNAQVRKRCSAYTSLVSSMTSNGSKVKGYGIAEHAPNPAGQAGSFESETVASSVQAMPLLTWDGVPVPMAWEHMTDVAKTAEAARLTNDNNISRITDTKRNCVSQGHELCTAAITAVRTADEIVRLMDGTGAPA